MPTVTRFLGIVLTLAAVAMAAVLALAYLVSPQTRTFTLPIDPSVLTAARPLVPPPATVMVDPTTTGALPAATDPAAPDGVAP